MSPGKMLRAMRSGERITWLEGDLLGPLAGQKLEGCIDVIVSNPPYIAETDWVMLQPEVRLFEPRGALVAGLRGRSCTNGCSRRPVNTCLLAAY